ncbi:TIR domain-containing protein [Mycobacterium sp. E787]|uniref:nSTAND1 domain-containing NTPase n=1 Tax=Mycobacterium sp. E787 TaxID=1834150 RepID=UPI001E2A16BB|nr:TIR domain-containing protein [Mycobacterium sp. E787]
MDTVVLRIFLSHSSLDSRQAVALKQWLSLRRPQLANEIFLDIDTRTGLQLGDRWKGQLFASNARCELVICLLSRNWEASHECKAEYRIAEGLGKRILCVRLEDVADTDISSEWRRFDLFADGPHTELDVAAAPELARLGDVGEPVRFNTTVLEEVRRAVEGSGVGPENFVWPPDEDRTRAPYRGWEPFESIDAAVFFGRDAAIVRGVDELRAMRLAGTKSLFVVLGPSGSGKSSYLRAGLIPRLQREDGRFAVLGILRPERAALTGDRGLGAAIHTARAALDLPGPPLDEVNRACLDEPERVRQLLIELRSAAMQRLGQAGGEGSAPTLILPVDQAEELFAADAGPQAELFLHRIAGLAHRLNAEDTGLIIAATIRTDRYEVMQNHPALAGLATTLFNELKPMPPTEFREVIVGPARRGETAGEQLRFAPALVQRLIADASEGADSLPLLSLTLARLYGDWRERRQEGAAAGELTPADYDAMGAMRNVVNNEVEAVLAEDPARRRHQLDLLRSAFIPWLATVNPDSDQPMRRVARYRDLPAEGRPLIDALVERRLLVRDQRDGEVVVEVALESFLRQWESLAGWLRQERQHLITIDDVERGAAAWQAHWHDPAWLLSGTRLTDAETLEGMPQFGQRLAGTRGYLAASRYAAEATAAAEESYRQTQLRNAREREHTADAHAAALGRRSRILRRALAGTAVVAVIAIVGAIMAVVNTSKLHAAERQAQSRFYDVTAARLRAEAADMLAGSAPGGDIRAFDELLAAHALAGAPDDRPLVHAAAERVTTLKIIDTGTVVLGIAQNGGRIASAGRDNMVHLWDAATGRALGAPLRGHTKPVMSVAFSPDGHRLATASEDNTLRIWDAATGRSIGAPLTGHTDWVTNVAFSPDGRRLVSSSDDDTLRLWDADTGRQIGDPLTGHTASVNSVAFSPDGHRLASAGSDRTARIWDADTGKQIGAPLAEHDATVWCVAFSPDGRRLATGGADRMVRLWDVDSGKPIGNSMAGHTQDVTAVAFSPDGRRLVSGSTDNTLQIWDADTRQPLGPAITGHTMSVDAVEFTPDGHRLVSAADDQTVRIWDADQPLTGHTGTIFGVAFSPDGHRLATGSGDHTLRLWNLDTLQPVGAPLSGHTDDVTGVAFSPDGHRLASSSWDGTVRLWDADTGRQIGAPLIGTGKVSKVVFSPDGHRLASAGWDGTVRLWDADAGRPIGAPMTGHASTVTGVAFTPDGRRIASSSWDGTVRLWDADSGRALQTLRIVTTDLICLAISPDGHRLVTGSRDGTLQEWNLDTGRTAGAPTGGHIDAVTAVAFSPDGRRLASASIDHTIRLWDARTGDALMQPLVGHDGGVWAVAFAPDGQRLASGGVDATVRVWPLVADSNALCDKMIANISQKDWRAWVSPDIPYVRLCPGLPTGPGESS